MNNDDIDRSASLTSEEDELTPISVGTRVTRAVIALMVVVGLLYFFGVRQALFLRRTPPQARQPVVENRGDVQALTIPLTVFVMTGDGFGSQRDEEDVRQLIEKAGRVWQQANINVQISSLVFLAVTADEFKMFRDEPRQFIANVKQYNGATINVFLARTLGGSNGVAYGGTRSVAVADYTSVYDFRALAHEIGHVLALNHVPDDVGRLMFRGVNGFRLSPAEIAQARQAASEF